MSRIKKDILPDKLSDLLEVAVNDAKKCGADPRYKLAMQSWHEPRLGVCNVCLAGSVIAKTLKTKTDTYSSPGSYHDKKANDTPLSNKLMAINSMRVGVAPVMECDHGPGGEAAIEAALLPIRESFLASREQGRAEWGAYEEAIVNLRKIGY